MTVFDTDLNELSTLNVGNPTQGFAKGIGLTQECCPGAPLQVIDSTVCLIEELDGSRLILSSLTGCDGVVCEGEWMEEVASPNLIFDDCDNSVTLAGPGCGSFVLSSDGLAAGAQCGEFTIRVNLCATEPPTATVEPRCNFDDATLSPVFSLDLNVSSANPEGEGDLIVAVNGVNVDTVPVDASGTTVLDSVPLSEGPGSDNALSIFFSTSGSCVFATTFDLEDCTPCPLVDLTDNPTAACSSDTLLLADLIETLDFPERYDYVWISPGDGVLTDAAGNPLPVPVLAADAVGYVTGNQDAQNGSVTLTLDLAPALTPATCDPAGDSVTVSILKANCGDFFWDEADND